MRTCVGIAYRCVVEYSPDTTKRVTLPGVVSRLRDALDAPQWTGLSALSLEMHRGDRSGAPGYHESEFAHRECWRPSSALARGGIGDVVTMTTSLSLQTASEASLRERFQRLAAEWKEQSRYLSNMAQMATLRPYQRIIGMGPPAVP